MQQYQTCPRCGAHNNYGERFCGNCGFNLVAPEQNVPPSPPPQPPGGPQNIEYQQQAGQFTPGESPPMPQNQPGWGQQAPMQNQQAPGGQQSGWTPPPQQGQPMYGQQPPHMPGQPIGWINQGQQEPYTYGTYSAYGDRYTKNRNNRLLFIVLAGLIVVLFTVGGIGLATDGFKFGSSTTSSGSPTTTPAVVPTTTPATTTPTDNTTPEETTTPATTTTIEEITAAELITDYGLDDVLAAGKYGGKTYKITGYISSYMKGASPPTATLIGGGEEEEMAIDCSFATGTDLSLLVIDEQATIQGRISTSPLDEGGNIQVSQCEIIN